MPPTLLGRKKYKLLLPHIEKKGLGSEKDGSHYRLCYLLRGWGMEPIFLSLFHNVPVSVTNTVGESHVVEISKAGDVYETRIWTVLKTVFP